MIISPRETVYIKFIKKIAEGEYLSINKSVEIQGMEDEDSSNFELVNIQLAGYIYKESKVSTLLNTI